jgi:hypothetical protein
MEEVGCAMWDVFALPGDGAPYEAVSQSDLTPVDDYVEALRDLIHRDALLAAGIVVRSPEEVWGRQGCSDRTSEAIPRVSIGMKKYSTVCT